MDDISTGISILARIIDGKKRPGKLNLSLLSHITAKFSDELKIGEGGCSHVYKGILPSGQIVAVKKLLNAKTMDDRMFQQEVTSMMRVKHQNIVRFLGYCSHIEERAMKIQGTYILVEERERLLCFDYMSKGSLADYVTDELRGLGWHTRFQIIMGICKGLDHLHNEKGIIHMDLKPANILLDDDFVPKITDFGISRAGEISKTISQERICSLGYCAAEYLFYGKISFKSDIYSLGVIIREIVTGSRDEPNTATVHRRWRHRWKKTGIHTTFRYQQQLTKCLKLAQSCKNEKPTERPNIEDIIRVLNELENTGEHISDTSHATKSAVEEKYSFLVDMLEIEPLELHFSAELNKKISHSIQLSNDGHDYVAFEVSATGRLPFHMVPNKDIIPPRSSCSVTITLDALKKRLREEHCKAELCVQSASVDKDLTSQDITADIFMEEPEKVVDTVNLKVRVGAPTHLLVAEPLELCYWPIEANKLLPCSLQLTNRTDDYVAFKFILPQGKVLYYQAMGMGIMPPWSTQGFVIYILVKETLANMQYKDKCLVRSMIVEKHLGYDDITVDMFYERTCVQELELDIVFAQLPQASSSMHPPIYDDEQNWEDDDQELTGDRAASISPFSIETELLRIYPAELCFASEEEEKCISLTNKTDNDVVYAINGEGLGGSTLGYGTRNWSQVGIGVVPPQSTCAVVVSFRRNKPYVGVMMISGSHSYRTGDSLRYKYTYDKREALMNQVRAEGGKAQEALLACALHSTSTGGALLHDGLIIPPPADKVTIRHIHSYNGLDLRCVDVHPMEPWVALGFCLGSICIWKMEVSFSIHHSKTNACEIMSSRSQHHVTVVKFIARMQWVACGDSKGHITVYRYADDRLTEIKNFQSKEDSVHALAVHPTHPYLLSSCKCNLIKLWDWDQGWMCTREFSSSSTDRYNMREISFNPKDANSFASLDDDGEINIWSIDSEGPTIMLRGDTIGIAYCNTGTDLQCMATVGWQKGRIEILDLQTNTRHVDALEATGLFATRGRWFIACHPTRPVLAIAERSTEVFLWNYTTYGLMKIPNFKCPSLMRGLRFMHIDGFIRLVVAGDEKIEILDLDLGRY